MISKLDFVAVPSTDWERSRAFYVDTLGLRPDDNSKAEFWVGETCCGIYEPTTVGVQHASGRRLVTGKGALGLAVPDGWRVVQDHPWRGLVANVPDDVDPDSLLGWLLATAEEAATLPLTGRWRALFYGRS